MQILDEIFSKAKPSKLLAEISLGKKNKKEFEETVYWNKLIAEKISDEENKKLDIFFKCWKRDKYQLLNFFIITDYTVKLHENLFDVVICKYVVQCFNNPDDYIKKKFFNNIKVNDYLDYDATPTSNIEYAQIFSNPEDNFYFTDFYGYNQSWNYEYFQAIPINPVIKY